MSEQKLRSLRSRLGHARGHLRRLPDDHDRLISKTWISEALESRCFYLEHEIVATVGLKEERENETTGL